MTKTPRTDAKLSKMNKLTELLSERKSDRITISEQGIQELICHARQLEREVTELKWQVLNCRNKFDAAQAEINHLKQKHAERVNDDQKYLVEPLCTTEECLDDCQKQLAEAQAENNVLKAALWHYGNRMGPNVGEELKDGLPEKIWRKINLREIEETDGEAAE